MAMRESHIVQAVRLDEDEESDVLYVRLVGTEIKDSSEAPHDYSTIINYDANGQVVGLQIIGAMTMRPEGWLHHPDRGEIPTKIVEAVDSWLLGRSGSGEGLI